MDFTERVSEDVNSLRNEPVDVSFVNTVINVKKAI